MGVSMNSIVVGIIAIAVFGLHRAHAASFRDSFNVLWAPDHADITDTGVELKLDGVSGSAFRTKGSYIYGYFSTRIKLVPGNSAGVVTSYYLSSDSSNHDELDFEFLGNVSGQPVILQTNVFANGIGQREERINLWFDARAAYHAYSVVWNPQQITFLVDQIPIRVFKNLSGRGISYPSSQPMGLYSSMFDASSWATRGGLDKIDWSSAPFYASYQDFNLDACMVSTGESISRCSAGTNRNWWGSRRYQTLSTHQFNQLRWVRRNYMLYDYCNDKTRYPTSPTECSFNRA